MNCPREAIASPAAATKRPAAASASAAALGSTVRSAGIDLSHHRFKNKRPPLVSDGRLRLGKTLAECVSTPRPLSTSLLPIIAPGSDGSARGLHPELLALPRRRRRHIHRIGRHDRALQ